MFQYCAQTCRVHSASDCHRSLMMKICPQKCPPTIIRRLARLLVPEVVIALLVVPLPARSFPHHFSLLLLYYRSTIIVCVVPLSPASMLSTSRESVKQSSVAPILGKMASKEEPEFDTTVARFPYMLSTHSFCCVGLDIVIMVQ